MRRERQEKIDLTDPALVKANQEETMLPVQLTMLAEELPFNKYPPIGTWLFWIGTVLLLILGCGLALVWGWRALFLIISMGSHGPLSIDHSGVGSTWEYVLAFALIVVGGIWELIARSARRDYKQQLLSSGPYLVKRTQGEVIWYGKRYGEHVPGMRVLSASMTIPLQPGPYNFFYEAESKLLLSAQPIREAALMQSLPDTFSTTGLPPDEQARQAIQSALCEVLHFTALDLQANRQGQLSTEQQKRWWKSSEVQSVEGEVEAQDISQDSESHDYRYVIDGLEVGLQYNNVEVESALVSGLRYRVYYTCNGGKSLFLLSIEPLQAPSKFRDA